MAPIPIRRSSANKHELGGDAHANGGVPETLAKWGDAARAGYQTLPDVLFRYQHRLGLNPAEMVVLMNVTLHWWEATNLPFPGSHAIANRMGITQRSVERHLAALQRKRFLTRLPLPPGRYEKLVRRFDPSGLVQRLQELARSDPYFRREGNKNGLWSSKS